MSEFNYSESDFEDAVLELFTTSRHYEYSCGYDIHRTNEQILLEDDFNIYLSRKYSSLALKSDEIAYILHNLTTATGTSTYAAMKSKLTVLRSGLNLDRAKYGLKNEHIDYIDYENPSNNVFRVVNQYEVKGTEVRRPDVVVFINGIPVSVIELKTVSEEDVPLHDAYIQIHTRYERGIPNLMQYSFVSVISDGANTKAGSMFADYDHFFMWKSTDGVNYVADGIPSLHSLIDGLFDQKTLLNILKNYIYFPDTSDKELMVVPKYSQYYASELLFENIKKHLKPASNGKGGTYFGATGCGKSYTMLFLARRLTLAKELDTPTILLLTDRTDLDDQLSQIFESSKEYLVDSNVKEFDTRKELHDTLIANTSGGVFLMTIQKFDASVDLLSTRSNIICISDEAHRTQVNLDQVVEIDDESLKVHYGFAKYLRDSFPNATYVGFTGTPIDATVNVFGPIVCSYKMSQAVADHSTVGIKMMPGPSSVRLDEAKLAIVDKYYAQQLEKGANVYQVEESKKEMAKVRTIIDNPSRLDKIVTHFLKHYEKRVEEGSTVCGKAMFVCYDRKIAFEVYKRIIALRPDWNVKKKTEAEGLTEQELDKLEPIEKIKLVATRDKDDEKELYDLLGDDSYREKLSGQFKNPNSNFKIVIVVDMWITGFDCECLDTMYVDKPLEKHTLIQTISRVNRVFAGKDEGLIVDYIGLESSLAEAMRLYNGDINPVSEVDASYLIFKDQLSLIDAIMVNFDNKLFFTGTPLQKLDCLNEGVEYVQKSKDTETRFMGLALRMKKAYDICVGDERITDEEVGRTHLYCAIRAVIYKLGGEETPDATKMNNEVKKLVDACISVANDEKEGSIKTIDIFSDEYLKKIEGMPYKNTKFKMLLELLRRAIKEYGKKNMVKAKEFSERMKELVDKYNARDGQILVSNDDVINDFMDDLTNQAKQVLEDLKKDAKSFDKMGITFEEKSFYDILKAIRDKYKFEYSEEKLIDLAKKVKVIVDDKSKYTDWSSRSDIKNSLESDIIRLLSKNGYPPVTLEEVYEKVLAQAENFMEYDN
jgi:type I restriction enzyme R subunit